MGTYKNPTTGVEIQDEGRDPQDLANQGFNPTNQSITPSNLVPQSSINLNPQQPDITNYNGILSGGLETSNAALALANKPKIQEASSIDGLLASLGSGTIMGTPPSSSASLYESTYGVGPTQAEISIKQETERKAQEDFDILNAQMRAINAEAKAIPIKVEKDYAGRASMSAIEGMSRAQLRDLALRSLPLEGQILAQQAILTGSQRALSLASEKFDKVFQLRMADQDRQYDYMKEQRRMIYDTLTRKEQQQIDAMNKADDIKREEYKANSNQAQKLSQDALTNGQADIAAKITALDPKSATFAADLAKLQGQIFIQTPKQKQEAEIISNLILKNSDAGILPTDTLAQAQEKIKNSQTYKLDIEKSKMDIQSTIIDNAYKKAQMSKIYSDINAEKINPNDTIDLPGVGKVNANAAAYAQTYASTGKLPTPAELKAAKLTFAQVLDVAKSLPKNEGMILDRNTSVSPSQLSSTQLDGMSALYDLTKKLDDAKTLFTSFNHGVLAGIKNKLLPSEEAQKYNDLRLEISDLLARARTGAAINTNEERIYNDKLPGNFNKALFFGKSGTVAIDDLKKSLSGKLKTNLDANGVLINGYSKIKLADGKEYTVGSVISANGQQGRINADGSITIIQ